MKVAIIGAGAQGYVVQWRYHGLDWFTHHGKAAANSPTVFNTLSEAHEIFEEMVSGYYADIYRIVDTDGNVVTEERSKAAARPDCLPSSTLLWRPKMKVVIIGAGALGAGFLYPLFTGADCQVMLLDKHPRFTPLLARNPLQGDGGCQIDTDMIGGLSWANLTHGINLVITATPPSALLEVAALLRPLSNEPRTVLCCENYYDPAGFLRQRLPRLSRTRFVNGIAHVCAFTASDTEIWHDDGWLEVEEGIGVESDLIRVTELSWRLAYVRKLFLHNAPHAVIAYNGWLDDCETIPEAVAARDYGPLWGLLRKAMPALAKDFLDVEIRRFSNSDFPDPISRVARHPSRKLRARERLPALLTLAVGTPAEGLVADAVRAAIAYGLDRDPLVAMWLHMIDRESFLHWCCGLGTKAIEAVMREVVNG